MSMEKMSNKSCDLEKMIEKELKRRGVQMLDSMDMKKLTCGARMKVKRLQRRAKSAKGNNDVQILLTFTPDTGVVKTERRKRSRAHQPSKRSSKDCKRRTGRKGKSIKTAPAAPTPAACCPEK